MTENNTKLAKLVTVLPKPNIIVGDFNYSDIEWETKQAKTKQSRDFIQTTEDNFLQQYVNFPTHNSGRILDLVLSEGDNVISVEDQGKLGSSDHNMILIYIRGRVPKREKAQTSRDWKKADLEMLNQQIKETDWSELPEASVEDSWKMFKEKLLMAQEESVPLKKPKKSNQPPWTTQALLRQIRKKRRLWKKYSKFRTPQNYESYKDFEKKVKTDINRVKKKFERKLAKESKENSKTFYNYISSKKSNRVSVGPLKNYR